MSVTESGFEEVELRDGARQLGPVVAEWRDLAASIEGSSYFQTPDWVLSWWEDRGRPRTIVGLWRDASGQLEAVACLSELDEPLSQRFRLRVPIMTNTGGGRPHSADRCGWPVRQHRVGDVRDWAATNRRRSLLLRHLDHRSASQCVPPGARLVLTTRCPVLDSAGDGSVAPTSKNLAKDYPRYRRRLEAMGVTFSWTPPEQMRPDAVDLLFALHNSSRSQRGGSSFRPELHADFQRRLIALATPGCGPTMAIACLDGKPIAVDYGFAWRETFYSYQQGWDAEYSNLHVGTVLKGETIRLAQLNGLRSIDYLRGIEAHKYSWGAQDVLDETWLRPRGLTGWLLDQKFRLARRAQKRDLARVESDGRKRAARNGPAQRPAPPQEQAQVPS